MSSEKHGPDKDNELFTFPAWHNMVPPIFFLVIGPIATVLAIGAVWYYFSPKYTDVGYKPVQPVPYSHKLHAGELKIDCRYCHTSVETTPWAGVPPTQTCMNCHNAIKTDSPKLKLVRESWNKGEPGGKPIPWVRVHKLADYAYFDHSAHVQIGIGCESCHGRIDRMDGSGVQQAHPLSMGWCLDCHNAPEAHLRPKDKVTAMGYVRHPDDKVATKYNPPIHCSGCHR
jgi:hypothetical protein